MNAATKDETNALTLPERASVALGSPAHEVKLRELVKASASILTVTNKAGREECHAAYMVLKNTRVNINHTVEEVTEDAKKFTKAVKTEAARLLTITLAEEDRLQGLRDAWDVAEQARKDALIAAERLRVESIEKAIALLIALPAAHAMSDAAALADVITEYDGWAPAAEFEEFADKAAEAVAASLVTLRDMLTARQQSEQAARETEAARIAEAARIESEKAELAAQRIENERIANEQAAERQRLANLAAAQEAAAAKLRAQAEANLQAERDAQAELVRQEREKMAAEQAKVAEQAAKLAAQQAAADKRDADALAAQQAAEARDRCHGEALAMDAQFDIDATAAAEAEAERVRLQELADQAVIDAHVPTSDLESLMDANGDDFDPFDSEIIELVAENYGWSRLDAITRLQRIDFAAARAEVA